MKRQMPPRGYSPLEIKDDPLNMELVAEVTNPAFHDSDDEEDARGDGTGDTLPKMDPVAAVPLPILEQQRRKILKNLAVISFAWLFLFTGYDAIQNLQSSINKDEGLGTASVSVIYGAVVISSLFIPTALIDLLGYKWTIVVSMICYVIYMVANFYASWYTLMPASVIIGLGAAPLWSAKRAYVTNIGREYAQLTQETDIAVITRFFGIFFMVLQLSQVTGNAISSTVLHGKSNHSGSPFIEDDDILSQCGAKYCLDTGNNTNLQRPPDVQVYVLMGIFTLIGIIAICLICLFLDHVDRPMEHDGPREHRRCSPTLLVATFRHLRHANQVLLIPLTIYCGLEGGFVSGDFTRSYVSCALGIWMVGFVMICFGVSSSLFSYLSGKMAKHIGRMPCLVCGALVQLAINVTILFWQPRPSALPVFFVIAALWGFSGAIWQTHINALYGCIFSDDEQDAAFSNLGMWGSIGYIIAFAYSSFICTTTKIYILIGSLIVGMICYGIVELNVRKRGIEEAKESDPLRRPKKELLQLKGLDARTPNVAAAAN